MKNLTTLITGASRGIGLAIAKRLIHKSSELLICSKSEKNIIEAESILKTITNSKILSNSFNHSDNINAAKYIGNWAKNNVKKIDLLVLNAGYYVEGSLEEISSNDFEENFRINFSVNHYLVQELLPLIKKSNLKRIVIIGSTAGFEAYQAVPTYGVAKWALRGYAINLRKELIKENIGVTYIAPGGTLTDMWEGEDLPPNRLLEPDDIAKIVDVIPELSSQAVIDELIVRPILGDFHD